MPLSGQLRVLLIDDGSTAEIRRGFEQIGYSVALAKSLPAEWSSELSDSPVVLVVRAGQAAAAIRAAQSLHEKGSDLTVFLVDEAALDQVDLLSAAPHAALLSSSSNPIFWKAALQNAVSTTETIRRKTDQQDRWLNALESAGQGVWDWKPPTNEIFFAPQMRLMFGYDELEFPNEFEQWEDRVHPEDLVASHTAMASHLRGETPFYQNEHRFLCKDGRYKWILDLGKIVERAPDGTPLRVVGTSSDISERKQTELELARSETRFRSLFEQSPIGIEIYDADGALLEVNQVCLDQFGIINPAELRQFNLFNDPNITADNKEALHCGKTIRYQGPFNFEIVKANSLYQTTRSGEIWLDVLISPLKEGTDKINGYVVQVQEITDRKRAEETLRESEERYRLLFENMNEGFSLHEIIQDEQGRTVDFRILDVNQAYEQHTGIQRQTMVGRTILEALPQSDKSIIERYGEVALGGPPLTFEYYSGVFKRHLRVRAFSPRTKQFATIFEDITARSEAELALRDSEQKYRVLFENEIFAIIIFDQKTGQVLDANAAALRLYGYTREEMLESITALDLIRDEEIARTSLHQTIAAAHSRFIPLRYNTRKDGTVFPVEIVTGIYTWRGLPVVFSMIHDISDRVEAERALRDSQSRLSLALSIADLANWEYDSTSEQFIFNDRFYALYGTSADREGGYGMDAQDYIHRFIHPEDQTYVAETIRGATAPASGAVFAIEHRIVRGDGSMRWIAARADLGSPGKSIPPRIPGVHQDITERKEAEVAIQKLLAEKELLMREVHHRVKNNMATITSLLAIQARDVSDPVAVQALHETESRVRSMMTIYDRLYRTGTYHQINTQAYLSRLLSDIAQTWQPPNGRVTMVLDIEDISIGTKLTFPLGIILNEWITNAYKYAFPDGRHGTIRVSLRRVNAILEATVADDGAGIARPEELESTTGFGMLLVKSMAQQIEAKWSVDHSSGTRFTLKVPLSA